MRFSREEGGRGAGRDPLGHPTRITTLYYEIRSFCHECAYCIPQSLVFCMMSLLYILGDWHSDAIFLYLNLPLSQHVPVQHTLAST